MKKNKKFKIWLIPVFILLLIPILYIYAIHGEKLDESDFSWITTIPIAHRGLDNGDVPENSMESFKKAIENGYAIELDVQLTKDKELIVFHDSNLLRVTGDSRDVKDVNYADLKDLKLENTEETIQNEKITYIVKEYNGKIGVFKENALIYTMDVHIFTLPEYDKNLLACGIKAEGIDELYRILGEYYK
jgi:hypothetical protein